MSGVALPQDGSDAGQPAGFQQRLGLFDATMLVAGSMIGSGIFIVSADISRDVGSAGWLLFVWALTGFMTIVGALSYAELAAMMPHAGGQYVYLRESYGPHWAFLYGWTFFLVIQTGFIAAVAVAFAKYLGVFIPELSTDLWSWPELYLEIKVPVPWLDEPLTFFKKDGFAISRGQFVAVGVVVFLSLLNCLGVQAGKWVQNIFTVAKTLGLLMLIVLGLTVAANADAIRQNLAGVWSGIWCTDRYHEVSRIVPVGWLALVMLLSGTMVGALFSSDAWNNVTFIAGEVRNPRRTLPWSLFLGTGMVIVLYLLANIAYLVALPIQGDAALAKTLQAELQAAQAPEERAAVNAKYQDAVPRLGISQAHKDRVATAVLEQASPRLGVPLMAAAIMISTFGCVNGLILMGARLYYAMAKHGLFFKSVGTLNTRGVPAAGLLLQGLWSIVLIFSGSYNELLDYIIFAALLFYVLTVSGLFVLRRKHPDWERPYRAIGYPVLPAIYLALATIIMLSLLIVKPVYSWPSFIIVLTGIPVYVLWRRRGAGAKR